MRNRFDHVAKQLGQKALGPSGITVAQSAINPETQYADLRYEPDPARQAERDRLGLLGRLAAHACIIEVYSEAPQAENFRACLVKHLTAWQQRVREARSESKKRGDPPPHEDSMASFLWIIAAGTPASLATKLRLERAPGCQHSTRVLAVHPPAVHEGPGANLGPPSFHSAARTYRNVPTCATS